MTAVLCLPLCAQTVGQAPIFVVAADFNHDGYLDLAVANTALGRGGSISILLGNGDGTFRPALSLPGGNYPRSIAVADFNHDGNPDLAVANESPSSGGSVTVFPGNGDGTFQTPSFLMAGTYPASVVAADFNGDGKVDLAVANSQQFQTTPPFENGSVSVFPGNDDGTFGPPAYYRAGASPIFLTAADLNGDGIPDLAAADFQGTALAVLMGVGDGTFQAPLFLAAGHEPFCVAAADLDGDGTVDLVSANGSITSTGGSISVTLGAGSGSFQPTAYYRAGQGVTFVAVGDFNKDGVPDLAVADDGGPSAGGLTILLGNGDGTFQSPISLAAGQHPEAVAVGDYNRDGNLDLAVVDAGNNKSAGAVLILLGDGAGHFH
ncbi:MAG TPA: VCBS repeat-containing protein [Bryobacteraceae bacterium]|nr:VCBS repeat-containing protein [Bryobacteraceae bacterium]